MKKILLVAVCCLFLCGCDKYEGYQVSELTPNNGIGHAKLKGTLRNISNDNCKEVQINVEFSSGTIQDTGWIIVETPNKGESVSFNEILYGASGITDIENYEIKFKNIKCYDSKGAS